MGGAFQVVSTHMPGPKVFQQNIVFSQKDKWYSVRLLVVFHVVTDWYICQFSM